MSEPTNAAREESAGDERYGTIETGDGDTIIYDREAPDAWVQSNVLVACEA